MHSLSATVSGPLAVYRTVAGYLLGCAFTGFSAPIGLALSLCATLACVPFFMLPVLCTLPSTFLRPRIAWDRLGSFSAFSFRRWKSTYPSSSKPSFHSCDGARKPSRCHKHSTNQVNIDSALPAESKETRSPQATTRSPGKPTATRYSSTTRMGHIPGVHRRAVAPRRKHTTHPSQTTARRRRRRRRS